MAGAALEKDGRAFPLIRLNEREPKPRGRGITEIRGLYHTPMGGRYLEDLLETMGTSAVASRFKMSLNHSASVLDARFTWKFPT